MLVLVQVVVVATVVPNFSVPLLPKFVPVTVTGQSPGPEGGLMVVMVGGTGLGAVTCESNPVSISSSTLTL
jgi:hypothetical protein